MLFKLNLLDDLFFEFVFLVFLSLLFLLSDVFKNFTHLSRFIKVFDILAFSQNIFLVNFDFISHFF
jgi:hypothetical protein